MDAGEHVDHGDIASRLRDRQVGEDGMAVGAPYELHAGWNGRRDWAVEPEAWIGRVHELPRVMNTGVVGIVA